MNLSERYKKLDLETKKRWRQLVKTVCNLEEKSVDQYLSDWTRVRRKNRQPIAMALGIEKNELFPEGEMEKNVLTAIILFGAAFLLDEIQKS